MVHIIPNPFLYINVVGEKTWAIRQPGLTLAFGSIGARAM